MKIYKYDGMVYAGQDWEILPMVKACSRQWNRGNYRITPYSSVELTMSHESCPGVFGLWIFPADSDHDPDYFPGKTVFRVIAPDEMLALILSDLMEVVKG